MQQPYDTLVTAIQNAAAVRTLNDAQGLFQSDGDWDNWQPMWTRSKSRCGH